MKRLMTVLGLAMAAFAMSAQAASHAGAASMPASGAATTQQNKMSTCSADFKATGKAGTEREAFMKECLKKESDAKTAQNNKMKTCSADFKATGKPGAEREAFMKVCLSKS